MKLLLLGGYRFLGRAIIEDAQARGHAVTAFNCANLTPLADVEEIRGDRDDPHGLAGRQWDSVDAYVFVSTLNVYADPMPVGGDESVPRTALPEGADPNGSDLTPELYGVRKTLCEDALEATLPGRNVAVRAGFIVGPHDNSAQPYTATDVARACLAGTGSPVEIVGVNCAAANAAGLVPWQHIPLGSQRRDR